MIDFNTVRNMPRSEQALLSVYSYLSLRPKVRLIKIECEPIDHTICVRVFYTNTKTEKPTVHSYNFFRNYETDLAEGFANQLCREFDIELTNSPV